MGFREGGPHPFGDAEGDQFPGQSGLPCGLLTNCALMSPTALWSLQEGTTGLAGPEHPAGGRLCRPRGLRAYCKQGLLRSQGLPFTAANPGAEARDPAQ